MFSLVAFVSPNYLLHLTATASKDEEFRKKTNPFRGKMNINH